MHIICFYIFRSFIIWVGLTCSIFWMNSQLKVKGQQHISPDEDFDFSVHDTPEL